MRVWSRGLGRVELAMDVRKVVTVFDGKALYLTGRTEPPVGWDFVVIIGPSEAGSLVRMMLQYKVGLFFRRFLHLRMTQKQQLAADYALAVRTRTGVKPDIEYAEILKLAPAKSTASMRSMPKVTPAAKAETDSVSAAAATAAAAE
ncbi:MAG: hypothetical protein WBF81_02735, partial [Thermoplasmata archaeon]